MKKLTSWLDIPADSDFSIHNLPFGIFSKKKKGKTRAGIAIGNHVVDLAALAQAELIAVSPYVFRQSTLNDFIALGKEVTNKVRLDVQKLLVDKDSHYRKNRKY